MSNEYILLKFGTIKNWHFECEICIQRMEKYLSKGMHLSVALHRDTIEQKEILCEIIDIFKGTIQSDWTGEVLTKEQAKDYIKTW